MKTATLAAAMLLSSQSLLAADVKLNSICYLEPGAAEQAQAFNPNKKEIAEAGSPYIKKFYTKVTDSSVSTQFRIASLSKVFTSHWAITELGPDYRFATKIIITPGEKNTSCHIHFQGDYDPMMGRQALASIIKQVNARKLQADIGCTKVESVTFDEKFRFFPEAIDHQSNPEARMTYAWSNPAPFQRPSRTQTLLIKYLSTLSGFKPTKDNVGMSMRAAYDEYAKDLTRREFVVKSIPMFRILKEMNRYSHNYLANMIFDRLGGADRYAEFLQSRLSLDTTAVHLLNGSGYPKDGEYNIANCGAITYMLRDLDNVISNGNFSRKYQLADVLPIGGMSEPYSTFKSFYSSGTYDKTLVAKTGSANQAITFAGALSTQDGNLYFAALTSPVTYGNPFLNQSRFLIKDLLQIMAERQTLKPMVYTAPGLTPAIDEGMNMKEVTVAGSVVTPKTPTVIPIPDIKDDSLDFFDEEDVPGTLTIPLHNKPLLFKKG
jgi:D-alanyl-D-alanine carboxypeptidase (penicillin-binding protein 4)